MTPHDAWDYDGVNEMILVDLNMNGQTTQVAGELRPQRVRLRARPPRRQAADGQEVRPDVNWASSIDMTTGRPDRESPARRPTPARTSKDICPAAMGSKDQQPASYDSETGLLHRADQPQLHGLQGLRDQVQGRIPVRRRDREDVSRPGRQPRRGDRLGSDQGRDRLEPHGAVPGLERHAHDRRRRGLLRHDGRLVQSGRREDRQDAVEVPRSPRGSSATRSATRHAGKQYVAVFDGVGGWAGWASRPG